MAQYDPSVSAGAEYGRSFERGVDIKIGDAWQPIRRISDVKITPTPKTKSVATYDDRGADNSDVTAWSYELDFSIFVYRDESTGAFLPEVETLKAATRPEATGSRAVVHVRTYDKPSSGKPNPLDAIEGDATVSTDRGQTGVDGEVETMTVKLSSKGQWTSIKNPFEGWADGSGSGSGD
jgi:hypothetical protein